MPFQVIGVDYAYPLKYKTKAKTEGKAYVLLYACSLTRTLFLDLLPKPLSYAEDDVEIPILTPSSLLYLQPNALPELKPQNIQDYDLRKRAKYISKMQGCFMVALDCRVPAWTQK